MFPTGFKRIEKRGEGSHGFWIYGARLAIAAIKPRHEIVGIQGIDSFLNAEVNTEKS
jgi:hypothetical protein